MSILSAIPLEVVTGGFSAAMGFVGSLVAMKQKAASEHQNRLLERHAADESSRERAEGGTPANMAEKRWTRRTIALVATFSILLLPVLAGIFGVHVTTGWTELSGGFWPFTDAKSHMVWHQVSGGIVITPLHSHTLSAIIGFYFGSSIAENARAR
jgi:hypothetical protein